MQELIIASNNSHKVAEIKAILGDYFSPVYSLKDKGIDADIVEDGDTFEANALIKARAIHALYPESAVLADDSGLMVDALGGAPGVHSARYASEDHNDEANNAKLLKELSNYKDEERSACFVSVIALLRPNHKELLVRGECHGFIGFEAVGTNGFGYDPLFILPQEKRSFAQLSSDEKNRISHRYRSLALLENALRSEKD